MLILKSLKNFLEQASEAKFRYQQLRQAILHEPHLNVRDITVLPSALREKLVARFGESILPLQLIRKQEDPQAQKLLFQLKDGKKIESVYMQFQEGLRSLCISTQVGCPCQCAFCATGGIGFQRHLDVDEIISQILYVQKISAGIDRVTVMGMGEALLNPNIFDALKFIIDSQGLNFSPHRISVSTVGIIPGIKKITEELPQITLTFSLHFPEQKLREQWIPTAKHYHLDDIFKALDERAAKTNHKIYLAYMIIDAVNNRPQDLDALEQIFKARGQFRHLYHINLIPFHAIPGSDRAETLRPIALRFQKQLEQRNIAATVRQSFGKSIKAACGQLAAEYQPRKCQ